MADGANNDGVDASLAASIASVLQTASPKTTIAEVWAPGIGLDTNARKYVVRQLSQAEARVDIWAINDEYVASIHDCWHDSSDFCMDWWWKDELSLLLRAAGELSKAGYEVKVVPYRPCGNFGCRDSHLVVTRRATEREADSLGGGHRD